MYLCYNGVLNVKTGGVRYNCSTAMSTSGASEPQPAALALEEARGTHAPGPGQRKPRTATYGRLPRSRAPSSPPRSLVYRIHCVLQTYRAAHLSPHTPWPNTLRTRISHARTSRGFLELGGDRVLRPRTHARTRVAWSALRRSSWHALCRYPKMAPARGSKGTKKRHPAHTRVSTGAPSATSA